MKAPLYGRFAAYILVSVISIMSYAEDINPDDIIEKSFWGGLYSEGGETFYCNKPFTKRTPLIAESYIYATPAIREHLQCGTNRQCKRESLEYRKMLSDLHNIVPSDSYFEFKRKSANFGILDDSVEANECGIRKSFQVIEPKDEIKGDIARTMLYMHSTYDLPLKMTISDVKIWNELDPPDEKEKARNDKITKLQGNGNKFIETPSLIDEITN